MRVDACRREDVEAVVALWRRCDLTRPWNDPYRDIEFARSGTASDVLVGWDGGMQVAAVMVGHDGHRGAVYYLAVDPDHRQRGFGSAMMAAAEDWLRERDVWKLNLLVREENRAAGAFYEELGYVDQRTVAYGRRLDGRQDRLQAGFSGS